MNFSIVLRIVLISYGAYLVYNAIQMKSTNQIPQLLMGKGFEVSSAKDPAGFIKKMFPQTMVAGILIFSLSIFDMYANLAKKAVFDVAVILIIGVVIIVYSILLVNAQKKYLAGYFKDSRNVKK
ncbi:MAG: hypothetical protein II193_08600 [Lachnospiraceae bacterium]|nr:hypothetical protein [Lachnospiraceae bacterium]